MALSRVKTFVSGEVLYAADINAEWDNILNNPISLISPMTGSLNAGGYDITAIDEVGLSDATANASAAGRMRRNGAALSWHDGTAAINVGLGYGVGAWAFVTLTGSTPAITDSFNVTSITDNGVGEFTLTWDRDFANATYMSGGFVVGGVSICVSITGGQAAGTTRYNVLDGTFTPVDKTHNYFAIGDQ